MKAFLLGFIAVASASDPNSAFISSGDHSTAKILDVYPGMGHMIVTDTVKTFDHNCFNKQCGSLIEKTRKEHSDFDRTWKCLQTSEDGGCVEGETWSDFPDYQMKVMDCGHQHQCIGLDVSGVQSLLEEDEVEYTHHEHSHNTKSRILDAKPDMKTRLVTDTVADFQPKCFQSKCSNVLQDAEKQHPDFTKTWKCLTSSQDGGVCVDGKSMGSIKWGDFSTYEMGIMDCGHRSGCLKLDFSNTDPDDADGADEEPSSFAQEGMDADEGDEDLMNNEEETFLHNFDMNEMFSKEELAQLSHEDLKELRMMAKNKMEDVAVSEAVLQSFQELEEKKKATGEDAELDTEAEFEKFYNSVLAKLNKVGDTSKVNSFNLETRIAKATQQVSKAIQQLDSEGEDSEIGKVRKPTMASMSVDSTGKVTNNLRNEK